MQKFVNFNIDTTIDNSIELEKRINKGDTLKFTIKVFNNGVLSDLTNDIVNLVLLKADGTILEDVTTTKSNGIVTFDLSQQATLSEQTVTGTLQITESSTSHLSTNIFTYFVNPSITDSVLEASQNEIKTLGELMVTIKNNTTIVNTYADSITQIAGTTEAVQSLAIIESYIDTNLSSLETENGKAVINIPNLKTENDKAPTLISNLTTQNTNATSNISTLTTKNVDAVTNKTNLDSSISTATTTKIALDTSNTNANVTKSALDTSKTNADTTKTALDLSNTNATATKTALNTLNTTSTTTNTNLNASNTTALATKSTLDTSNTNANTTKSALDTLNTTANTTKTNLTTINTTALATKSALDTSNATANTTKTNLDSANTQATSNISAMSAFGDVTQLTQTVTNLKTEVETARGASANLDSRLDLVDTSLSDRTKIDGNIDDTGSANTYVIAPTPAITAYSKYQTFKFVAKTANTGASTLNVNGLGVKSIVKSDNVALVTGDILVGQLITAIYDGINFQIVPDYNAKFSTKGNKNIVETLFTGSATLADITLSKDVNNYNCLIINFAKSSYGNELVKVYATAYPSNFTSAGYEYHYFKSVDGDFRFRTLGTSFLFNNSGVAFASPIVSIKGVFEE